MIPVETTDLLWELNPDGDGVHLLAKVTEKSNNAVFPYLYNSSVKEFAFRVGLPPTTADPNPASWWAPEHAGEFGPCHVYGRSLSTDPAVGLTQNLLLFVPGSNRTAAALTLTHTGAGRDLDVSGALEILEPTHFHVGYVSMLPAINVTSGAVSFGAASVPIPTGNEWTELVAPQEVGFDIAGRRMSVAATCSEAMRPRLQERPDGIMKIYWQFCEGRTFEPGETLAWTARYRIHAPT